MVVIGIAMAPSAGQAAPIRYGCDTAAGRFSPIVVELPSAGFEVSGTITPEAFRKDPKWVPTAVVRVEAIEGGSVADVRFVSEGATARDGLVTFSVKNDGTERKGNQQLLALGQPVPFVIKLLSDSEISVTAGKQAEKWPARFGSKLKLTIACSTGDFIFSDLEWKNTP
jgi:hypothetical protein